MRNSELNIIQDEEGVRGHCEVISTLIGQLGINPHTKHHIRAAVREVSNKITPRRGKSLKERAHYMSIEAYERMKKGSFSDLIADHMVPISVVNEKILNLDSYSIETIKGIIHQYAGICVITKEENKTLGNKYKLNQRMPEDWDGINISARYKTAGIEYVENQLKELSKSA